jgi:DNA-binding beta-propeller fold protein YncE
MALRRVGDVDLPEHATAGDFDHAAVHRRSGRVYVAHTANDAVDVIDGSAGRYIGSIAGLPAVAGALASDEHDLVFTSNRGENTVGIFAPVDEPRVEKVAVGVRPNGLAYDARRGRLLAANVGDPNRPESFTVSIVDVAARRMIADLSVAGRTRWTVADTEAGVFYVNVADPPLIVVVDAVDLRQRCAWEIPAAGPHGLDLDAGRRRLFCACDAGRLVEVDADSGKILRTADLSGVPDVVFFNPTLAHLYVAVGEPGVIDVFDTETLSRIEVVATEAGAHTTAWDQHGQTLYAFLPGSHRAAVYRDTV